METRTHGLHNSIHCRGAARRAHQGDFWLQGAGQHSRGCGHQRCCPQIAQATLPLRPPASHLATMLCCLLRCGHCKPRSLTRKLTCCRWCGDWLHYRAVRRVPQRQDTALSHAVCYVPGVPRYCTAAVLHLCSAPMLCRPAPQSTLRCLCARCCAAADRHGRCRGQGTVH